MVDLVAVRPLESGTFAVTFNVPALFAGKSPAFERTIKLSTEISVDTIFESYTPEAPSAVTRIIDLSLM